MRRIRSAIVLLGLALALVAPGFVTPVSGATRDIVLFGDAALGWGATAGTITNPGPDLTASVGDTVRLELTGEDSEPHNWFIDYNDNLQPDSGEPGSADFTASTIMFTFTPSQTGTFTYRCRIHPTTMTGEITIQPQAVFTLYGSAEAGSNGWGLTAASITQPGPTLTVDEGDMVTIDLIAADDMPHTFVVDYDGDSMADTGEPKSPMFSPSDVLRFTFQADRAGTFQYFCDLHGASLMNGTIVVQAAGGPSTPAGDNTLLIIGGVLIVVVIAGVAAAMVLRKKKT